MGQGGELQWHSGRPKMDGPEGGIGMKSREGELREDNRAPDGPKWTAQSTRWKGGDGRKGWSRKPARRSVRQ